MTYIYHADFGAAISTIISSIATTVNNSINVNCLSFVSFFTKSLLESKCSYNIAV